MSDRVGLIAAGGRLPALIAERAHARRDALCIAALRGFADEGLRPYAAEFVWVGIAQIGRMVRFFLRCGAREAIFAGDVTKGEMYSPTKFLRHPPDLRSLRLWRGLPDRRDTTILSAVAGEFASEGIEIVSPLRYLADCLTPEGPITRPPQGREPDAREREDIAFGLRIARILADLDVGQSVLVKDKAVVAMEAIEGTDATVRRGGELARGGAVLVKVSRPRQDPRFDIPCAGPQTVDVCAEAGVSAIALEAGSTLLLDGEEMVRRAVAAKIALFGVSADPPRGGGDPA